MSVAGRIRYWRRLLSAYALPGNSQLTFWHDRPTAEPSLDVSSLGPYYMAFDSKADYAGPLDGSGVPQLDYHGAIGVQYNPIAIAQYGLGNYNLFLRTGDDERLKRCLIAADWLAVNLERYEGGAWVWQHHFDFEYRDLLTAPWRSGLAQGQGISLLVRAHKETGEEKYMESAQRAFESFLVNPELGGVVYSDDSGQPWIEEYPLTPPTHILNGFIWGLWGVRDYGLATKSDIAFKLEAKCIKTLVDNLHRFDTGRWSLYDLSATGRLKMITSGFYHGLHIVQLGIMATLTGNSEFTEYAERWDGYSRKRWNRIYSKAYKALFKVLNY